MDQPKKAQLPDRKILCDDCRSPLGDVARSFLLSLSDEDLRRSPKQCEPCWNKLGDVRAELLGDDGREFSEHTE